MVYYNPHIIGWYNPLHTVNSQGFFSLLRFHRNILFRALVLLTSMVLGRKRVVKLKNIPKFIVGVLQESKKSPTGPTERTPKKPEYLIARSQLTERGPLGFGPIQFLMDWLFRNV